MLVLPLVSTAYVLLLELLPTVVVAVDPEPKYERIDDIPRDSIETMWQLPEGGDPVKGIVFLAHGCQHQGTDFFAGVCQGSNFGRCLGLPEERALVEKVRSKGYVALAVSGSGPNRCWDMDLDVARVEKAIGHVISVESLPQDTSIFAIGASSGGYFVGELAATSNLGSRLKCISPQISAVRTGLTVPTLFIHMTRDVVTSADIQTLGAELEGRNVTCQELRVDEQAVTATLLHRCMNLTVAHTVVQALFTGGFINEEGYLLQDPRQSRDGWFSLLKGLSPFNASPPTDSLLADESPVSELLNVAWAQHEITSKYAEDILDFCEKGDEWTGLDMPDDPDDEDDDTDDPPVPSPHQPTLLASHLQALEASKQALEALTEQLGVAGGKLEMQEKGIRRTVEVDAQGQAFIVQELMVDEEKQYKDGLDDLEELDDPHDPPPVHEGQRKEQQNSAFVREEGQL